MVVPASCFAENFLPNASYDVCFTPGDDCANKIIKVITQAKKEVLVQAYVFTDMPIARALIKAKSNGVNVRVILDRSQIKKRRGLVSFLTNNKINLTAVDYRPSIAHNKVMIIDGTIVITGSYNYSNGARNNAENIIIIKDSNLAKKYIKNWYVCEQKKPYRVLTND